MSKSGLKGDAPHRRVQPRHGLLQIGRRRPPLRPNFLISVGINTVGRIVVNQAGVDGPQESEDVCALANESLTRVAILNVAVGIPRLSEDVKSRSVLGIPRVCEPLE